MAAVNRAFIGKLETEGKIKTTTNNKLYIPLSA